MYFPPALARLAFAFAALTTGERAAGADDAGAVRVALTYTADGPGCPAALDAERGVAARTRRARIVAPGEPAERRFSISIVRARATDGRAQREGNRDGLVGRLESADGAEPREIRSTDCSELADALAFVAALAVDPSASPTPLPILATPPPPPQQPAEPDRAPSSSASPWTPAFRVGPILRLAATPTPQWGLELLFEATRGRASARLGGVVTQGEPFYETGSPTFTSALGALSVCPMGLELSSSFVVRPCVGAHAGVVRATGRDVAQPRTESFFWADVGPEIDLRWKVFGDAFLYANGQLLASITRPSFVLKSPDKTLYDVPLVTFGSSVGGGVVFR